MQGNEESLRVLGSEIVKCHKQARIVYLKNVKYPNNMWLYVWDYDYDNYYYVLFLLKKTLLQESSILILVEECFLK